MPNIIRKSNILPWSIENINSTPSVSGVYVLRESTSTESIIYIGSAENLERRLKEHFLSKDISGIFYFDWYETENTRAARDLERIWINTYNPKFNIQHNF